MSIKKKILSAVTALALAAQAVSFSGCSQNVNYAMEVDGEKIAAGLYILYSGQALSDAQEKLKEDNPDLDTSAEGFSYYDQKIGDMSFGDYVEQEAVNYCKRHVAVNRLFDELNIPIEKDEKENLNDSVNSQWDYDVSSWSSRLTYLGKNKTLGAYYESIGVSKSSFREFLTNTYKASKIFTYYYGEGGIEEVSKADKEKWLDENYALVRYFGVSITDSEGKVIESKTQLAILEKLAEEYVGLLNDGTAYKDVYKEYQAYVSEQSALTGSGDTTAAPEATTGEEQTADTTSAEARARAAEGGETEAVTAAPEETEPEEATTAAPEETEPEEVTEGGTDLAETTENAPEETVSEGTTAPEATTSGTGSSDPETTTDGTGTAASEAKDSDYDRIIGKESTSPSKEFVAELFAKGKNTAYMFKADTYYYVVQKLDILNSEEDYVKRYDSDALSGLKDDDMEDVFKKRADSYTVVKNSSAPDYCSQQADNAANGLMTISQIQYMYYYSQMFGM